MELPPFTVLKLHVLPGCCDEKGRIKCVPEILMSLEKTESENILTLLSQMSNMAHIYEDM